MGTLYLVATPIGNLEDISARALRVLRSAALIAAEDTRHTVKLLRHYEIDAPLTSYHEFNKLTKVDAILSALAQGDVALVSDAGTPALNDPGYELVQAALQAGFAVSPIPGPSAPIAALTTSGLPTDRFVYLGYLPRKANERRAALHEVAELPYTLVFLETPHRLLAALQDLQAVLGDRPMAAARELTKLHEEVVRGPISVVLAHFAAEKPRGEFTLVVAGFKPQAVSWSEERLADEIRAGLAASNPPAQLAAQLASASGRSRREIYQQILEIKKELSE
ncbi:MAG TPA: 16S rRNA (cytidine(1402)-2'-O)-methyltransferase [Anaerolineales bacterium]|nr:16S rRNA (cytidine(1402)-2'-O)-methyltransferase [Anaerolineales bacterium]